MHDISGCYTIAGIAENIYENTNVTFSASIIDLVDVTSAKRNIESIAYYFSTSNLTMIHSNSTITRGTAASHNIFGMAANIFNNNLTLISSNVSLVDV